MLTRSAPLLAALLVWAPTAWAQDLGDLQESLQKLARDSIAKTVLIKVTIGPRQGAGSGAIISPDGYILTCTHVAEIGGGTGIEVVTSNGKKYQATLLGRNKRQDYALIKIDAQGLDAFTIGDSDTVKPGDWVVALGHPGGPYPDVQPAFAAGRVLDLDRKLPVGMMSKYYNHAIMTDVPIFAGDSGGPLVNLRGELIGINGAIVMINDLAFAIPTNQIMPDMEKLRAGTVIPGEAAGKEAFVEMQKLISPEDYQKMTQRMMKNFGKMFGENSPLKDMFGGKDSPFGKMFGGEDSPFAKMFGGKDGEMPDLGKLFGGGNGEMPDLGKLFGGGNGEMPDLGKLFGEDSPFGKMFGGEDGEMPDLSKLFGGKDGEAPDFSKLFGEDSPFGKMFGGKDGEMPDLGKLFGGKDGEGPDFGKLFGGGGRPERQPEPPKQQGPRPFVGIKIAPTGGRNLAGVLVEEALEGGPAAKAGLKKGDVILSLGGKATPNLSALRGALAGKRPGERLVVELRRTVDVGTVMVEKTLKLQLTLGSR